MITRNANALPVIHDCAGGEHVGSAHECESLVHGDEHVYESCPAPRDKDGHVGGSGANNFGGAG
jgi:hypothetical protein